MVASQGPHGATQSSIDPTLYADFGSTHHNTHELDKLTTREAYHDTNQVCTTNGTNMRIHNIGHAILAMLFYPLLHLVL
jgi:hypothetical protein